MKQKISTAQEEPAKPKLKYWYFVIPLATELRSRQNFRHRTPQCSTLISTAEYEGAGLCVATEHSPVWSSRAKSDFGLVSTIFQVPRNHPKNSARF